MSLTALELIKQKIIEDAKRQAEEIIRNAEESGRIFYEEAKESIEKKINEEINKGKKEAELIRERKIAEAKVYAKRKILESKEQIIEDVFKKVYEKLKELTASKDKYKNIVKSLIKKSGINLGGRKLKAFIFGSLNPLTPSDIKELEKIISEKTGVETTLEIVNAKNNSIGGVKVVSEDGRIEVDNTFESIIDRLRDDLRALAAKIIFSEINR